MDHTHSYRDTGRPHTQLLETVWTTHTAIESLDDHRQTHTAAGDGMDHTHSYTNSVGMSVYVAFSQVTLGTCSVCVSAWLGSANCCSDWLQHAS